jgi:hypothetical protein
MNVTSRRSFRANLVCGVTTIQAPAHTTAAIDARLARDDTPAQSGLRRAT